MVLVELLYYFKTSLGNFMNQLLIFDLDGTLIDSRRDIAGSLNFALAECGFATLAQETIEEMVGKGAKQLVGDALGNPSEADLLKVYQSFWHHYKENCLNATTMYPGAREFLAKTSHWHQALITNKPQVHTDKILAGLDLHPHFSWVIGGDLLPVRKPDPNTMEPIHQELKHYDRGVMIGDSLVDLEFGRAVGLTTCLLTHGFGKAEELVQAKPDYLVDDFTQLAGLEIFR